MATEHPGLAFRGIAGGQQPGEAVKLDAAEFVVPLQHIAEEALKLPVCTITWFDAVLFCNAKSKREGLDTVYTYFVKKEYPSGNVYDLTGLRIHYEIDGYRLPTESEWEFAAREGNSQIPFPLLRDKISAQATASFKHGFIYLRPSRRSAVYPLSPATAVDFIGFRCARGVIPHGAYITTDTMSVLTNAVDIINPDVKSFLTSSKARLVFVNVTDPVLRTLCFIDFNDPYPRVREFTDNNNVHSPTISPDGKFVAFCTGNEGFGGASSVYIRCLDSTAASPWRLSTDSGFVPRWRVDLATNDTCLVYTNSAIDNASADWPITMTMLQTMRGGRPVGDPRILASNGSFHDGLSSDGLHLVTGYTRCLIQNMTTHEEKQLFLPPFNGKDLSGSTQVCNVSISNDRDHGDRCLFLDFGYGPTSSLTQTSYGPHQYLFVMDFSGNVVSWIKCPDGEDSWDYPEWAASGVFAAATTRGGSDDSRQIRFVNLGNKTSIPVVQGEELENPYLWITGIVSDTSRIPLDSLGAYYDPPLNTYEGLFSNKMHFFWKMHQDLDVVFVGSSQTLRDVDCTKLTNLTALNMGISGAGIATSSHIVRDYALNQCPKLKVVCMSAMPCWMANPGGDDGDLWSASIAVSKGYAYDQQHNFWKTGLPSGIEDVLRQANFFSCCGLDSFGLMPMDCQGWGKPSDGLSGRIDWTTSDTNFQNNFNALTQLANDLSALKIHLLLVLFPFSPYYANTGYFAAGGPSSATGDTIITIFKSLETNNPYFHFYDAYKNGNNDYTDQDAGDYDHLCTIGAAKLTMRLDSLIHQILGK